MEQFTIRDLESLSGIKAHTIRVWERRYSIIRPLRTDTNRRRYTGSDLRRIINISILIHNGFKISKIAVLTDSEVEEKTAVVLAASTEGIAEIDLLVLAMFALNTRAVNETIMKSVLKRGLEDTFTDVIFPFMNRIGIMWQTGTVNPGYEHFMTNIFRNRLITALDGIPDNQKPESGKALLFLPENELHELPLPFFAWLARKMNYEIMQLGQMTPLSSVIEISEKWNPDFVITGTVTGLPEKPLEFLKELAKAFSGRKTIVAGTLATVALKSGIEGIIPIRSVGELKASMSGSSSQVRR